MVSSNITQSVMQVSSGNVKTSSPKLANSSVKNDFSNVLDSAKSSGEDIKKEYNTDINETDKLSAGNEKKDITQKIKELFTDKTTDDKKINTTDDKQVNDIIEDENLLISGVIQIIQEIAKQTGTDVNQVVEQMQQTDMKFSDLLDKGSVTQLISDLLGNDNVTQLITNADQMDIVKDTLGKIDAFIEDISEIQGISKEEVMDSMKIQYSDSDIVEKTMNKMFDKDNIMIEEDNGIKNQTVIDSQISSEENSENNFTNENTDDNTDNMSNNEGIKKSVIPESKISNDDIVNEKAVDFASVTDSLKNAIVNALPQSNDESVSTKIINQILDTLRATSKANLSTLEIQLEPETLGKVSLSVTSKAGAVTAQIAASNEVAREAIESQLSILKENLSNQGIKVDAVEVTVASHQFEQNLSSEDKSDENGSNSKQRKHISKEELEAIENGEVINEDMKDKITKEMGNTTVSYTA